MNPHHHPPKIKSVAMDQLPTPRTDRWCSITYPHQPHDSCDGTPLKSETPRTDAVADVILSKLDDVEHYSPTMPLNYAVYHNHIRELCRHGKSLERELLATQERLRVLRSALENISKVGSADGPMGWVEIATQIDKALNHP